LHDVQDLDQRGIPGGCVASDVFVEAAAAQAQSLGFEPGVVYVPHPIQDRTDAEMRAIAEQAFEQVMALIKK
jgi:hypothetical protein